MNPESGFLDRHVRPDPRDQLFLADQFTGALDQGEKNLESAASQNNRPLALPQYPLDREQPKGSERQHVSA
jgi:hypothetical protein